MTSARPAIPLLATMSPLPKGRSPLAHLLHALNQPLTGLQCSLELAVASPRLSEQYVRTLREGLELTGRMRILVEAVRELVDLEASKQESESAEFEPLLLDALLRDAVADLLPVAESKRVQIKLRACSMLPVRGDRRRFATLLFRFLDSTLSLAREDSELRLEARPDHDQASLLASWEPGTPPEHSPFSRQELGLLIAQAGWESAGAKWKQTQHDLRQSCTVLLPLALSAAGRPQRPGDLT